jgi:outer membrane protein assembly factor BamB
MRNTFRLPFAVAGWALVGACVWLGSDAGADDWPMWGRTPSRNMVGLEKDGPTDWDFESGRGLRWRADLGSQSYGNPVVAGGLVIVGTNNEAKRDPRHAADGGVLAIFRESDGKFLWQQYSAKLKSGRVNDWPYQGICSTALVEGALLWYCTNRCEVICLDLSPLREGKPEPREVWRLDMTAQLGVFPHNMTSCSVGVFEDLIYIITGNGADDTHRNIPVPKAPSIVCLNKNTGKVVWTDNSPGENVLHGQWSSPTVVTVNGRPQAICPLGDAWVYSFEPRTGKILWRFDANRKDSVYPAIRNELIATPVVIDNRMYIATGQDPEHGEGPGTLWCVDITREGDISAELDERPRPKPGDPPARVPGAIKPNPNSGVLWVYERFDVDGDGKFSSKERMHRSISTVAVHEGLVFAGDFSGFVHCLDALTGKHYWTYDMEAAMWGSPMVADGKLYVGDEDGDVAILAADRVLRPIATHNAGSPIYSTPVLANGTLYVMCRDKLFAIGPGRK